MRHLPIVTLLIAACGGTAAPGGTGNPDAGMHVGVVDPVCGAHGISVSGACYCGAGYTGAKCETPPPEIAANEPCTPNTFFCEGAQIKSCTASGKQGDATLVKDCATETVNTSCAPCAATGAPACQAAVPSCAGSVSADGNPVTFSTAGCSTGTTCELAATGTAPESGSFHGTVAGFGHIDWVVSDMAAVASGVPFKLNDATAPFTFDLTTAAGVTCQNANEVARAFGAPPRAGSVKLTFGQVSSGQPLTFDVEGPLYCGGMWSETTAHVTAVWQ